MWEGAIGAALALFLSGFPRVIAFLAILIIGWLIASARKTRPRPMIRPMPSQKVTPAMSVRLATALARSPARE